MGILHIILINGFILPIDIIKVQLKTGIIGYKSLYGN